MHCPDTMIEIHRERVQDQTLEMFSGDPAPNLARYGSTWLSANTRCFCSLITWLR